MTRDEALAALKRGSDVVYRTMWASMDERGGVGTHYCRYCHECGAGEYYKTFEAFWTEEGKRVEREGREEK